MCKATQIQLSDCEKFQSSISEDTKARLHLDNSVSAFV